MEFLVFVFFVLLAFLLGRALAVHELRQDIAQLGAQLDAHLDHRRAELEAQAAIVGTVEQSARQLVQLGVRDAARAGVRELPRVVRGRQYDPRRTG